MLRFIQDDVSKEIDWGVHQWLEPSNEESSKTRRDSGAQRSNRLGPKHHSAQGLQIRAKGHSSVEYWSGHLQPGDQGELDIWSEPERLGCRPQDHAASNNSGSRYHSQAQRSAAFRATSVEIEANVPVACTGVCLVHQVDHARAGRIARSSPLFSLGWGQRRVCKFACEHICNHDQEWGAIPRRDRATG